MSDPDILTLQADALTAPADWAAAQLRPMPEYISHGEILSGRSPDGRRWSDDLGACLARDFAACIASGGFVLEARSGDERLGVCAVFMDRSETRTVATIEDVVVGEGGRGHGTGTALMAAAEARCLEAGADHIMLESGLANDRAHAFFKRRGYRPMSKVFLKTPD